MDGQMYGGFPQGAFGPMGGFGGFMQQAPPPVTQHQMGADSNQGFNINQAYQPGVSQGYDMAGAGNTNGGQ